MSASRAAKARLSIVLTTAMAIVLSAGLGDLGTAQADGTGQWSTPVQISQGASGWWPAIAADDRGSVHIVWQAPFPDARRDVSALFHSQWNGQRWSIPNDIALMGIVGGNDDALRSSIDVGKDGRLQVSYKGLGALIPDALGQKSIWNMHSDGVQSASASSWSKPVRITQKSDGYFSDIAVDAQGVTHILWTESTVGKWGIFYSRSKDGGVTWSSPLALDADDSVWWYRAHLVVDTRGRLHAVWETLGDTPALSATNLGFGVTLATVYAQSTDGGQTWSQVRMAAPRPEDPGTVGRAEALLLLQQPGPQQPAVGVDGAGNILLVYRELPSNRIVYLKSEDGSNWSQPSPIPGIRVGEPRPYDIYDMATDSAGHVHLVAVGYAENSDKMSLLHSEWFDGGWSKATPIIQSPPYPEYPRLAIGEGNRLHVVWFVGDRPSVDRRAMGVRYSTALTTAPQVIARETIPPPSSQIVATPSVQATPTISAPSGSPTVSAPSSPVPNQSPRDRTLMATLQLRPDYPFLVTLALVVPLLGIVVLVKLRRAAS